ncbi:MULTISPECIES: hypothetical protein [Nostoc]|uniref:Uncharacterized protein n=1 Tax=Nostoc paludosum FACHB-159 TaxID=2692908 RepID=A0ABR8K7T0_9NOSO|nr:MULTISPECIES: hypothetical protein [Nostoc]MBD2679178.1 hypothetical protein [Nostoc sp. FACHB-857]MBD2735559.1 hypothetical protein [Nostoc paludosum FACHB-159]
MLIGRILLRNTYDIPSRRSHLIITLLVNLLLTSNVMRRFAFYVILIQES